MWPLANVSCFLFPWDPQTCWLFPHPLSPPLCHPELSPPAAKQGWFSGSLFPALPLKSDPEQVNSLYRTSLTCKMNIILILYYHYEMAETFIKYLAQIAMTILYFFFPTQVFFSYQSHFLHSLSFISRGLYGSSFHKSLALTLLPDPLLPVSAHLLHTCVCTLNTIPREIMYRTSYSPLSTTTKLLLRSTRVALCSVKNGGQNQSHQFIAREGGLWPWMRFSFFIYYPKMLSGPYHTSRQLTSRIHITFPQQQMILKILFQSLHLPPQFKPSVVSLLGIYWSQWMNDKAPLLLFSSIIYSLKSLHCPPSVATHYKLAK